MRKLSHEEVVGRQKRKMNDPRLPFTVVLNNIRSLYNVGSIFRTADGAGVEQVFLCGITGYPPDKQISKTALGAQERVSWAYREDVLAVISEMRSRGYRIVLLEQTDRSIPFESYQSDGPLCLVIGNEIEGVSGSVLKFADAALEIDMEGVKNSLNVAVAFGIVAFHIKRQLQSLQVT